jgi:hypothetical protein
MKQEKFSDKKYEIAKKTRHFYLTLKETNEYNFKLQERQTVITSLYYYEKL